MNRLKSVFSIYLMVGFVMLGIAAQADGQTRRNEREIRDLTRSLSSRIDDFRYSLTYQLRNNSVDRQDVEDVTSDLADLQKAVRTFSDNLDRRRENADDVAAILNAARRIDDYLLSNPQNRRIQTDWTGVQNLLSRLSANYNVSANQNRDANFPDDDRFPSNNYNYGLNGTYRLDASRSEDTAEIVNNSNIRGSENVQDLEEKLEAPEELAIDVRGNQVTLASSKAAPVTFTADGTTRTDNSNGRTVRLRASLRGEELTVSSIGGDTDYTITFSSIDNGRTLKVTRRITTDYLAQTVFADSIYTKTDAVARLGIGSGNSPDDGNYSTNDPDDRYPNSGVPSTTNGRRGTYIVPNGTMITGTLENDIDTKASQNNDRFRMTVQSPDQFRGATIEGYITGVNRSGKVTGRSQVTFNFQKITLRSGETYDFAGYLQSVTDTNGKTVKVGTEGEARGDSQTKETVKRGGIGAGIGAVIGAIAGGAKGAAIGAIIGGGAGAGSVVVQGKDDLELRQGSSITVQSSSPIR